MAESLDGKIVIAVSSRALFNFEEENMVFKTEGEKAYKQFQLSRIDTPAEPGAAFPLVKKLLSFNSREKANVEVLIISHNDPISGLRVFKSAQANGLNITRGVFSGGEPAYKYINPLGASLYLTTSPGSVQQALKNGHPAALIYANSKASKYADQTQLRVAFDGDGVLFGTESQKIYDLHGIEKFETLETRKANKPLSEGPLKPFLKALHYLQTIAPENVRTALVTARNAPSHERAIKTLMKWDIEVHEAFFLGGLSKAEFLKEFDPDIFFDDHDLNCDKASEFVPTAKVDHGV